MDRELDSEVTTTGATAIGDAATVTFCNGSLPGTAATNSSAPTAALLTSSLGPSDLSSEELELPV